MAKKSAVETDMRKFKAGKLHSGSKHGKVVTNPKQAVAIGLSEARKKGEHVAPNPGLQSGREHHSLGHSHLRSRTNDGTHSQPHGHRTGEHTDVAEHEMAHGGMKVHDHGDRNKAAHHPPVSKEPHRFDRPSAKEAHGYGHAAHQRHGAHRVSGHPKAHRVGHRSKK